ncbi:hypothetical protein K503DRAFT_801761 [Rhizopogon vinicolor AM-OR11-026]|uniref:C2H2-type domain-containing protein n=1 Tax=Rhizopogon vinicolor AM-OR11-026 TaxID=1314800 RepID=A0A1B7MW34_9AGAM|nr:hypothetical protein K503DRAFT_801761 [Rhizopogon vinicolor AM-OR11-026]
MSPRKAYVCSQAHCSESFTKFADFKKHEAGHARPEKVHTCNFPGCDFTTLQKRSFEIHYARHTGEQRYSCPHNCDFRTHDPSALTRHRKAKHGYVPPPRGPRGGGRVAAAPAASADTTPSSQSPASSYAPHPGGPDPSFAFYDQSDNNFPFTMDLHDFHMFSEPVRTGDALPR